MTWDWTKFEGSATALKWNRKELSSITEVVKYVKKFDAVVQAGGNLGIFPKRLSEIFKTVYTFEPDRELFVKMTRNAPEENIIRFQAALGCKRELVGMSRVRRDDKENNHEGITHVSGSGVIPTMILDDLRLPVLDLLYLDIEGFEKNAITGAQNTIARCRPVIACEINKSVAFMGLTRDDVRNFIISLGYRLEKRVSSDEVFLPC